MGTNSGRKTRGINTKLEKVVSNELESNIKQMEMNINKPSGRRTESRTKRQAVKTTKTTNTRNEGILSKKAIELFHEGKNYEAYKTLGSHKVAENGIEGTRFTTWAPNAKRMWIVGDFSDFKIDDKYAMENKSHNGLWSIFALDIAEGTKYKYAIECKDGTIKLKADPYAIYSELRPNSASIIYSPKKYRWEDANWIAKRKTNDMYHIPINIYEVHLGSWKTKDGEFLTYQELSEVLPAYVEKMGYTHVELMPLVEHPLDASWGYQGTGYYSLTSRYGTIEGFKKLVNTLHKKNIGVILDWVPGHFCKDSHGLYLFDGEPAYEYQEEWRANNGGWGTYNFDLGRPEVKSFLISNAMYWIDEFHIDGIRVDAVSNILYLDYDRGHGGWKPNIHGGNENLQGIEFIRELNQAIEEKKSNVMMIAEESTAWPNVCTSASHGGLGFNFKWNMGWMNDVLEYVQIDTFSRSNHHGKLTFAMMYNQAENYMLPISHDEVVHGKKSLVNKMFGDQWNRFAGLRVFLSFMMTHPGKKLTFMGCEFAQLQEWREFEQLDWFLLEDPIHQLTQNFVRDINKLYKDYKCLWELDRDTKGFTWIDADNSSQSILSYIRKSKKEDDTLIVINNFKSEVYEEFTIGVPYLENYVEIFNSDDKKYGGSGQIIGSKLIKAEDEGKHNQPYSINIKVPPMATLILGVDKRRKK